MAVNLSSNLQARIFEQMEGTYPNEGGGFLLGNSNGDTITIQDITQVENVFEEEEQYHRYAMVHFGGFFFSTKVFQQHLIDNIQRNIK